MKHDTRLTHLLIEPRLMEQLDTPEKESRLSTSWAFGSVTRASISKFKGDSAMVLFSKNIIGTKEGVMCLADSMDLI